MSARRKAPPSAADLPGASDADFDALIASLRECSRIEDELHRARMAMIRDVSAMLQGEACR